jgi:Flp pilus assembly protein TadD
MKLKVLIALPLVLVLQGAPAGAADATRATDASIGQLKENLKALETSIAAQRERQDEFARQVDKLRKDIYEAALVIREMKNQSDIMYRVYLTNNTELVALEENLVKQKELLKETEKKAGTGSPKVQDLSRQLDEAKRETRQEKQAVLEKEKQIEVLQKELTAKAQEKPPEPPKAEPAPKELQVAKAVPPPGPPVMPPSPAKPEPPAKPPADAGQPSQDSPFKMIAEGNTLLRRGDVDGAARIFTAVMERNPDMVGAKLGLAACAYTQNRVDQARTLVTEVVRTDANNAQALGLKGIIHWRDGEYTAAYSSLEKAIKIEPRDSQLHNYMGIVLHAKGRFDSAVTEMKKAIDLDASNAEATYNLSVLLATARNPDLAEARRYYEKALQLGTRRDPSLDSILYEEKKEKSE